MVALAIGLAVVGALIAAYLASFASGRHSDALVQITEDATLALNVMRQQVAQAGFSQPHGVERRRPGAARVPGASSAARRPASSTCRPASVVAHQLRPPRPDPATPDTLEVAYEGSVLPAKASNGILGGSGSQQPLDCLGNSFPKTHDDATGDDYWLNDSKFYVSRRQPVLPRPGQRGRRGAGAERRDAAGHLRHGGGAGRRAGRRARSSTTTSRRIRARRCGPTWCRSTCACRCAAPPRCSTRRPAPRWAPGSTAATRSARGTDGYLRRTFTTTIVLQNKLL